MLTIGPKIMRGINEGFYDTKYLLKRLEKGESISTDSNGLLESYPNTKVWEDLTAYAWEKWKVKIGFTKMPEELIFKGKGVLYNNALIFMQEMDKEEIAKAPEMEASYEVMGVYASLGFAVNDIANWLRNKYKIDCHSNHPLNGLANTVPLAVKAGMGYFGHNGLLITKEFGSRHRIAPIFIDSKLFAYTDSDEHNWIAEFCKTCKKCERDCPTGAILENKKGKNQVLEGIGRRTTSIDREKCFPYFTKTMGCSVCIKACPFSKGEDTYERLKKRWRRNKNNINKMIEEV